MTPAERAAVGRKDDADRRAKPRWSLLPLRAVAVVVDVLEYGTRKYSVDGWRNVPDARTRYYDAAVRHLVAWREGEPADPESSLPHLAHACCSLLFILALELETK